jgi:C4-type Zn-finger protein
LTRSWFVRKLSPMNCPACGKLMEVEPPLTQEQLAKHEPKGKSTYRLKFVQRKAYCENCGLQVNEMAFDPNETTAKYFGVRLERSAEQSEGD